jgi:hypothetical protein
MQPTNLAGVLRLSTVGGLMTKTLATRARSPLGLLLALLLLSILLTLAGLFLASDGRIIPWLRDSWVSLHSAKAAPLPPDGPLQTFITKVKTYDRPHLLAVYGGMIVATALAAGAVGRFIRTNQFRFVPKDRVVERRPLWLFLPLWVPAWALLFAVLLLPGRGVAEWLVRRLLHTDAAANPPALLVTPLGLLLAGGIAAAFLAASWRLLRPWLGRSLYVPGLRNAVPFDAVRRLEIQASEQGAPSLVLALRSGSAWLIAKGSVKKLQRLARTAARLLGLKQQDLVTWERS